MFENLDLNLDQISEALDLEKGAVELVLVSNSSKYRQLLSNTQHNENLTKTKSDTDLFSNEEVAEAARVFTAQLMADDEHLRQKAAKFIINESKGRHDSVKGVRNINTQINVNIVNEQMKRARDAKEAARNKQIEVINV